jgi:hypothetical protein
MDKLPMKRKVKKKKKGAECRENKRMEHIDESKKNIVCSVGMRERRKNGKRNITLGDQMPKKKGRSVKIGHKEYTRERTGKNREIKREKKEGRKEKKRKRIVRDTTGEGRYRK